MSPLTAEQFVDLIVPRSARICPNGEKVVYSASSIAKSGENETSSVWVAEIGKEKSARQLSSGKFNDTSPRWSSDGKSIAFLSDRAKAGESSAIYLLSMDGGEAYAITKAENKRGIGSFDWSPNGSFIAYLSADEKSAEREQKEKDKDDADVYGENWEYNRLRLLHVATREVTTLVEKDAHVAAFAWNEDSTELAFTLHETPDLNSAGYKGVNIEHVAISNRTSSHVCKFPGGLSSLTWFGTDVYFVGGVEPMKSNTSQAVYKTTSGGDWSKIAFGVNNCVGTMRRVGSDVAVEVYEALSSQIHLMSNGSLPNKTIAKGLSFADDMTLMAWDVHGKDENIVVAGVQTLNCTPPELYSLKDGELCQLTQHGAPLADIDFCDVEPFYCKAKDGTSIDALLYMPKQKEKKPLPTVVNVHGGPYNRSTAGFGASWSSWGPWLAPAGYAVLCPNYRGGSGHGEEFASKARGGMGTLDYDDVISIVEEGISRGIVDKEHVGIGGWSQGGFLSYLAVTRNDFHFKAAVCGAGVTDWDMMSMTSDAPCFESELGGGAPWEVESSSTVGRQGSAIWYMKNVKTPILILHGEKDVRVPLTQAVAFHRGCLHHDVPCEMVVYPREPHGVNERNHCIDILKRVRRFYDLHLR